MKNLSRLTFFILALLVYQNGICQRKSGKEKYQVFNLSESKFKNTFNSTVNNNVCKQLRGETILYAIFVDSDPTNVWTAHDISSTLDSICKATSWIEEQADALGIELSIHIDYHQTTTGTIPITRKLPKKTLSKTLFHPFGMKYIDRWSDQIAKKAHATLSRIPSSEIVNEQLKAKNKDQLIAKLRDVYQTDNVALIYFINNYYTDEISVAVHTGEDHVPEFGIISFKNPVVIAHEFLHLFGAIDLYISLFDTLPYIVKFKKKVIKAYENEIMLSRSMHIDQLSLSPITHYLIGWDDQVIIPIKRKKCIISKFAKPDF